MMLKSKSIQERKTNQKQKLVTLTKKKLPKHTGAYRQSAMPVYVLFFHIIFLVNRMPEVSYKMRENKNA